MNAHGKNENEIPKELVTFLNYVKEDLAGSEKEVHDPYVEQLQKFVRDVKKSREMEERFMIFEEMLKKERAVGREEGIVVERAEDLIQGKIETARQTLLLFLQSFGVVSKELSEQK